MLPLCGANIRASKDDGWGPLGGGYVVYLAVNTQKLSFGTVPKVPIGVNFYIRPLHLLRGYHMEGECIGVGPPMHLIYFSSKFTCL